MSPLHGIAPAATATSDSRQEAREDPDAAERRDRPLVPALAGRDRDEPRAHAGAEETPENRDGDR